MKSATQRAQRTTENHRKVGLLVSALYSGFAQSSLSSPWLFSEFSVSSLDKKIAWRPCPQPPRDRQSDQSASGSGRSWNFTALLVVPLPPSRCQGVRVAYVDQSPLPFQPPLGSSMRPSMLLAKNPMG